MPGSPLFAEFRLVSSLFLFKRQVESCHIALDLKDMKIDKRYAYRAWRYFI